MATADPEQRLHLMKDALKNTDLGFWLKLLNVSLNQSLVKNKNTTILILHHILLEINPIQLLDMELSSTTNG